MSQKNSCIRCGHLPSEKEKFCTRCGAPLQNRCTFDGGILGDPCNKVNPSHAAFCSVCGSPTLFHKDGLIQSPYPDTKKVEIEDLDSLNYFSHKFFRGG